MWRLAAPSRNRVCPGASSISAMVSRGCVSCPFFHANGTAGNNRRRSDARPARHGLAQGNVALFVIIRVRAHERRIRGRKAMKTKGLWVAALALATVTAGAETPVERGKYLV